MLKVEVINVSYGPVKVLHDVSLEVRQGEFVSIIGANGAGKTTTLKTIAGNLKPLKGSISFLGRSINGLAAHQLPKEGLAMVPEGRQVFANLSVRDNLLLGAYPHYYSGERKRLLHELEQIYARFPILKERENQMAGTLSGGQQQMVAIGRALMARPKLLMLDEPTLGLAPIIADQIFSIVKQLNREGTTVLLVEQMAYRALEVCDRAYVMETGKVVLSGPGRDLIANPYVKEVYLGA